MRISENGIDLICAFEGFRSKAYQDSGGIWTIGYGTIRHDGVEVKEHDICTQDEAKKWLVEHLQGLIAKINNLHFNVPLKQNQFDALCSFAYNLGFGCLADSMLYRKARQNPNDETIYKYDKENPVRSCEFLKFVTVKGKPIQGLINRRIKEADLYGSK